jgi:hypothetical protein
MEGKNQNFSRVMHTNLQRYDLDKSNFLNISCLCTFKGYPHSVKCEEI